MGTPVSKPDDTTSSQNASRRESRCPSETRSITPDDSTGMTTQMLCADDDEPVNDGELVDMYTSLPINTVDSHKNMNTKFDRSSLPSLPSIGAIDKQIFTSNGRIRSANGRVTAHFISAEMLSADNKLKAIDADKEEKCSVDTHCDSESEKNEPVKLEPINNDIGKKSEGTEMTDKINSRKSGFNHRIESIDELEEPPEQLADPEDANSSYELDNSSSDSPKVDKEMGMSSPTKTTQSENDKNSEPTEEGIVQCVPRNRFNSARTKSVVSEEIESLVDDIHSTFYEEIKETMTQHGFFDRFPSPVVINEAQKFYQSLDLPVPTDDENNVVPHPPKRPIHEIMAPHNYDEVFDVVVKMPNNIKMKGKPTDIVNYLCKGMTDETNKLYALVTYMVYTQLEDHPNNAKHQLTDTSLKLCKMLETLCKLCKLKSTIIEGVVRNTGCDTSEDIGIVKKFWMTIVVKESWILVDVCISETEEIWHKQEKDTMEISKEFVRQCVEYCFPEPTNFVFSHYPNKEIWQLLSRPVLEDEFQDLVNISSGYFDYGMELLTHSTYNIYSSNSEIVIALRYTNSKCLQFKCSFRICDGSMSVTETRRFVFLETVLSEHKINLRVRFPLKCSYILELFGDSADENWRRIVVYRITYKGDDIPTPFPSNAREEWGPGKVARSLGLEAVMYHTGEIITRKGVLQIAFKDRNCLHFEFRVHPVDIISTEYIKVSFLKDRKHNVVFVVEIDSKVNGTFVLQLMARTSDSKEDFQNFCNYFIRKEKSMILPIFKFDSKELLMPQTMPANEDGTLQYHIDLTKFARISATLHFIDKQEVDCTDHVRIWLEIQKSENGDIEDEQAHIDLNFPRPGKYKFVVRGQKKVDGYSTKIKEEIIQVDLPSLQWSCFPKTMTWWNSLFKVEEPMTHILKEKELINFCIYLIDAQDVAIVGPGGWSHLKKGDTKNMWVGHILTGPKSTRCRVQARFEVGSDKWSELLSYKILSAEECERSDEQQQTLISMIKNKTSLDDDDVDNKSP